MSNGWLSVITNPGSLVLSCPPPLDTRYTFFFWVHFALLPLSGDGDAFMTPEFQRTLVVRVVPSHPAPAPYDTSFFPYT